MVERHGARNPRVFGSVVHGTDEEARDLDPLVDPIDTGLEQRTPDAWRQLRDACDMRIVLNHECFPVDAAVVWETVRNDRPALDGLAESQIG